MDYGMVSNTTDHCSMSSLLESLFKSMSAHSLFPNVFHKLLRLASGTPAFHAERMSEATRGANPT